MKWQGVAMRTISEIVILGRSWLPPKQGLRILIYHAIGKSVKIDTNDLNNIDVELFRKHLDMLAGMEVDTLVPLDIPKDKLKLAITFDDGYADNLYIAAPLLVERKLPFTVFITSQSIRNHVNGYLSKAELKELANIPGAIIGSHSSTHPHLTTCNNAQLKTEMEDSKHHIEDLIGKPVNYISYPFGDVDLRVRDAAENAGYKAGCSIHFEINTAGRDKFLLNRCGILKHDSLRVLKQKINGDWDWLKWHYNYRDPIKNVHKKKH